MNGSADLRQYLTVTLRSWWLIVLGTIVGAAIGFGASRVELPVYQASTTLIVGQSITSTNLNTGDIQTSQSIAHTYADIVRRQPVLQATIEALKLEATWQELKRRVRINLVEGTQLLEIVVEAGTPDGAQATADEIARQLIQRSPTGVQDPERAKNREFMRVRLDILRANIESGQARLNELESAIARESSIEQKQGLQNEIDTLERLIVDWQTNYTQLLMVAEGRESPNDLAVVEPAQANPNPVRPRVLLNTLLAGIVGFLLSLGGVLLKDRLEDTLDSASDLTLDLGLTCLGVVSYVRGKKYQDWLLTSPRRVPALAEDYRVLRSSIQFMPVDRPIKSILVTSPNVGEGKTTMAINLGVVMAQAGLKTIIVDADLRRPMVHKVFQLPAQSGLADMLRSPELAVDGHLRDTGVENLQAITSGSAPSNASELLGSARMGQLLKCLYDQADIILLDSPSLLAVADALVLSKRVDGVLLVIEAGRTRRNEARQAIAGLQHVGANLVGGVLNRVAHTRASYGY